MKFRALFVILLVLSQQFLTLGVTLAHSGEPRLEISPARLMPGSSLQVRGINYEPEEEIQLTLLGPQVELPLGLVAAGPDGSFIRLIVLPEDLVEGLYSLRANTADHIIFSPQFSVSEIAPPSPEVDQDGQRDEAGGLLGPMSTILPVPTAAISATLTPGESTPAVTPAQVSQPATSPEAVSPRTQVVVLAIVFLVLISVVVLGRMAMGNRG